MTLKFKLKKKWTKWIPLSVHTFAGTDKVVFAKKNIRNGMMKFKMKRVNGNSLNENVIPRDLIDIKEAWNNILES